MHPQSENLSAPVLEDWAGDKPRGFEKPIGMRDILPETVRKMRMVETRIGALFAKWGYDEVVTPTLEFDDTIGGASSTLSNKLFKLLDKHGHTLVLRPDMTTPIARIVSSVMRQEPLPLRLSYCAHIFRAQENEAGRDAEFKQMGAELIGDASPDGDAEILALAIAGLQTCAIEPIKLAVGHVGFLNAFLRKYVGDDDMRGRLKRKLNENNYVGYRQLVDQLALADGVKARLHALLSWRGDRRLLQQRLEAPSSAQEKAALRHLCELWDALDTYGVTPYVTLDLSLAGKMNYYTGVYFEGYTEGHGFPLLSGGRYDKLLALFGRPAAAVGFQLKLDRVMAMSPLAETQPPHVLIAYDPSQRLKALQMAMDGRRAGRRVTMQVATQLDAKTLKHMRKRYDDVTVLRGKSDEK